MYVPRAAHGCPPRFHRIGGERGYLTIDNISGVYSVSKHPAVAAGKMTKEEALQELLNSFEGSEGNRDGKVTLDEWIRYYEEVSCSIDSDDYFGTMLAGTWSHLKQKLPDGSKVPAVKFTPNRDVELLEKKLKESIYAKTPPNTNSKRTAELAFKALDTNGSGDVDIDEFIKALERFGMHVSGVRQGVGGLPRDVVQALFDKYDADGSGNLSYKVCESVAHESPRSAAKVLNYLLFGTISRNSLVHSLQTKNQPLSNQATHPRASRASLSTRTTSG